MELVARGGLGYRGSEELERTGDGIISHRSRDALAGLLDYPVTVRITRGALHQLQTAKYCHLNVSARLSNGHETPLFTFDHCLFARCAAALQTPRGSVDTVEYKTEDLVDSRCAGPFGPVPAERKRHVAWDRIDQIAVDGGVLVSDFAVEAGDADPAVKAGTVKVAAAKGGAVKVAALAVRLVLAKPMPRCPVPEKHLLTDSDLEIPLLPCGVALKRHLLPRSAAPGKQRLSCRLPLAKHLLPSGLAVETHPFTNKKAANRLEELHLAIDFDENSRAWLLEAQQPG